MILLGYVKKSNDLDVESKDDYLVLSLMCNLFCLFLIIHYTMLCFHNQTVVPFSFSQKKAPFLHEHCNFVFLTT